MAKNMLKSYGRFELLELIYNMRKENLELKARCEAAERQVIELRLETEKKLEDLCKSDRDAIADQRHKDMPVEHIDIAASSFSPKVEPLRSD